jgi:predicted glutamine amidotransferase
MCRLFGQLTVQPESAEPWLVARPRSLLRQSDGNPEHLQSDGWGVGWFDAEGRARVEKGTAGAYQEGERERFVKAANDATGSLILGHLRRASNPLNLPPEQLIGMINSQPFENHTSLFVHNGSIWFPNETRPYTGLYEPKIQGLNDSEVLFWLLTRNVHEHDDPLDGYAHTVEDLYDVWESKGRPARPPFGGLNVLYSRGPDELWAFCLSTGEHGTGLLDATRPYYELAYQVAPHRVVVGSEPFDHEPGVWRSLPNGSYLSARRHEGRILVETGPIPTSRAIEPQPPAA